VSDELAVNAWGDLRSRTPRAEQARRTVRALLAAGVDVEITPYDHEVGLPDRLVSPDLDALPRGRSHVVDLHLDRVLAFSQLPGTQVHPVGRKAHAVGVWDWDLPALTYDMVFPLHAADEVWVGSTHVQDVFLRGTDTPVHVVPPVLDEPDTPDGAATPERTRADLGLWSDATVFAHAFDASTASYELAHLPALFDAYARAFAPHERGTSTQLVLAVRGLEDKPDLAAELHGLAVGVRARLLTDLDEAGTSCLLGLADAYVSLHRAESTGLGIFEAMRQGTPVVATAFGAHTDVASSANGRQVGYARGRVSGRHHHHDKPWRKRWPVGTPWVEPDTEQAAFWMRDLHERPAERARLGQAAREAVAARLSPAAVGAVMRARLQALAGELTTLTPRR
jgi:glycosyltransferase involved in cell wall biosynthesis